MVVTQNLNKDNNAGSSSDHELRDLLEKNLEMTDEVLKMVRKIRKDMVWQKVMSFIKILIIIVPLVLSIYFLPQIIDKVMEPYKELLGIGETVGDLKSGVDLDNVDIDRVKKFLQ